MALREKVNNLPQCRCRVPALRVSWLPGPSRELHGSTSQHHTDQLWGNEIKEGVSFWRLCQLGRPLDQGCKDQRQALRRSSISHPRTSHGCQLATPIWSHRAMVERRLYIDTSRAHTSGEARLQSSEKFSIWHQPGSGPCAVIDGSSEAIVKPVHVEDRIRVRG